MRGKLDKLYDKWQGEIKSFEKELLEWKANQDREITDLQNKKHNLEEEIEKMKDVIKPIESVVTLNVGGQTYTTSLQTLVKEESMLAAMFSGRYKLTPDKDGNYFIDRDGLHFRTILNYLRTGILIPPTNPDLHKELLLEAEFYQIPSLLKLLQKTTKKSKVHVDKLHWDTGHKSPLVPIPNNITATYEGPCQSQLFVRTTMSFSSGRHYFEIILNKSPGCFSSIGIATPQHDHTLERLGESPHSWTLRLYNNDSTFFSGLVHNKEYRKYYKKWEAGARVGLLVDLDEGTATYYCDRKSLGVAFTNLKGVSKVYPAVELCHNTSFTINNEAQLPPDLIDEELD